MTLNPCPITLLYKKTFFEVTLLKKIFFLLPKSPGLSGVQQNHRGSQIPTEKGEKNSRINMAEIPPDSWDAKQSGGVENQRKQSIQIKQQVQTLNPISLCF